MNGWLEPFLTVIGGASGFGAGTVLFRSGRAKEAQAQADRLARETQAQSASLIELYEHRHTADTEALKAAAQEKAELVGRVTTLEAQMAQLRTVEQIATALNNQAAAQDRLTKAIKAAAPESVRWSD